MRSVFLDLRQGWDVQSRFLKSVFTGATALGLVLMQGLFEPVRAQPATSESSYSSSGYSNGDLTTSVPVSLDAAAAAADASRYAKDALNECGRYSRGKPLIDCVAKVLDVYSARLRQATIPQKAPRAAQLVQEVVGKLRSINTNASSASTATPPRATAPTTTAPAAPRPAAIAPQRTITVTAPPTATIPGQKITVVTQPAPNKSGAIAVLARAAAAAASLVAATVMGEGQTVYDLVRGVLTHAKSLVELKG
jgi:hypothetical protein